MTTPLLEAESFEGPPPTEERRAAARQGSNGRAVCRLADGGAAPWYASIRDVSPLGIGLVLPSPVAISAVLEVGLVSEHGAAVRSTLARVVHVEDNGDRTWVVGCAFIGEMDEMELRAFQAEKVRPPGPDCRRWVRFPCNVETVCYARETAPGERRPVRMLNISAGSVGLLCPCDFPVGTLLHLELPLEAARLALIRVVRLVEHNAGGWFLGCEFVDQLAADEFKSLL